MTSPMITVPEGRCLASSRTVVRRPMRRAVAVALVVGAWLALASTPASAILTHPFQSSFNGSDAPGGPFTTLADETVDRSGGPSNGDVYVGNLNLASASSVSKFTSAGVYAGETLTGTPAGPFSLYDNDGQNAGIAVDNSAGVNSGDLYVADIGTSPFADGVVDRFSASGAYLCQITGSATPSASECNGGAGSATPRGAMKPSGIAVDAAGDLYVADAQTSLPRVDEFSPSGAYLGQIVDRHINQASGLAVDSSNNLYVDNGGLFGGSTVAKFDAAGSFLSVLDSNNPASVAVDPANNHVYVGETSPQHQIAEYDPSGNLIDVSGLNRVGRVNGLAVGSGGNVYATDLDHAVVDIFGPTATVPDVVTDPASNITQTSVTVSGSVNPGGVAVTDCHFDYGTTETYGQSAPCAQSTGSGSSPVPVSAALSGLEPGQLYHFRLYAANANGSSTGQDQVFIAVRAGFGIKSFDGLITSPDGSPDTQAGSHPYQLTTDLSFNTLANLLVPGPGGHPPGFIPDGNVKDIQVDLPVGLVGDATAVPQCTSEQLIAAKAADGCPAASQVGVLHLVTTGQLGSPTVPVYNLVPPKGLPARLGVDVIGHPVFIDVSVRTGGDYGLTATLRDISTDAPLLSSALTVWGVPADSSHDPYRGTCLFQADGTSTGNCPSGTAQRPLFTLPTACSGPQTTTVRADSWQNPGTFVTASYVSHDNAGAPIGIGGCTALRFDPSIGVQPDVSAADSPTGLHVDLQVPLGGLQNPLGLSTADLKTAVVALPAGLSVNPAAANGLLACSSAQFDIHGAGPATCPDASKVGTVQVTTPLLDHPLGGGVYVAAQNDNPTHSVLGVYIAVNDIQSGVVIKLAGHVHADPVTGQLTATFDNNPQVPFTDFKVDFFGGPRAVLATPDTCGTYTTATSLAPWSGTAAVTPGDSFAINANCAGGFAPSFTAGITNPVSGHPTGFTLQIVRPDGQQHIRTVTTALPPGLLANIGSVPLCSAPDAAAGSCGAASQIGTTTATAGPGPNPFPVGGNVFLTGPYKNAPYGLSIVVPVVAGPFNLGTTVVRAAIYIDPLDAHATIVSDDVPRVIDVTGADGDVNGFPVRIHSLEVDVNRPGFIVNPTNCNPMAVTGSIGSWEGSTASVSNRFQIGACGGLSFSPKLTASTTAKTSRENGASLNVKLTYPKAPFGSQANIARVKVDLPKQLPSRLTTLQKACTAAQFARNPANCPKESFIGHAKAITPVLPVPLEGPAIFVSHGGEAFPSVIVVLQGSGVTLDLVGTTFISKRGITSSTFKTVPDAPVGSFELSLPQGKFSALTANGNLCASKLRMPTEFTAQNGAEIKQSTKIAVKGCAANKHHHKRAKKGSKGKKK